MMPLRAKLLIGTLLGAAIAALAVAARQHQESWSVFALCLAAALVSSGLKVQRPSGSGSMSLNYPFVFLAVTLLSPLQTCLVAALSVAVQCRLRSRTALAVIQILFNVANSVCATACAYLTYAALERYGTPVAPALAVASAVYFVCNTLPLACVIGWSQQLSPRTIFRGEFHWFLPFYLVGAALASAAHLLLLRFGWLTAALLIPFVYTLYRAYTGQVNRLEERRKHLEETEALHLRTIEGLAMAIEAKDQNTHDHLFRVRDYVGKIAGMMSLDETQRKALQTAAFLHDIGKLAVPEHIINKPGKLTAGEFEKMKIHPVVGADILERVRFPYPVVPIVRAHHERWDGEGYPDGLRGESIPVGARILSVVDCFDALASDRPYRKAMPLAKAMGVVKSMSGTQFDPAIVALLEESYAEFESRQEEPASFDALNLELDVHRGAAPAAGFEQGGDTREEATGPAGPTTSLTCLNLIASASQEAQTLFEMSQAIGTSLSMRDTVSMMTSRLHTLIPFDCCAMYLKGAEAVTLQYLDESLAPWFSRAEVPLGEGISGWVAQSEKPILNGNATVEPNYCMRPGFHKPLSSALAIPLYDLQGASFGVLTLYACGADCFTRDHLRILQAVETKFSLAIQNAMRFRHAETDAGTDFLTGLPNARTLFEKLDREVSRCRQENGSIALAVCDLNLFKVVNDCEGHLTGNALLRAFGRHLRGQCRSSDTVARIGGDEFVLLLPNTVEPFPTERTRSIEEALRQACREAAVLTEVTTSIGIAFFPADGETAEELLATADRRMYLHKERRRTGDDETQRTAHRPVLVA